MAKGLQSVLMMQNWFSETLKQQDPDSSLGNMNRKLSPDIFFSGGKDMAMDKSTIVHHSSMIYPAIDLHEVRGVSS